MNVGNSLIIDHVVMHADINSPAIELTNIYGFAIQAVYTGAPTGTLKLQASVDAFKYAGNPQPQAPSNWTDITGSSVSISSAGSYVWNVVGAFYTFVRVVYTDGSSGMSTAVLTARINIKG